MQVYRVPMDAEGKKARCLKCDTLFAISVEQHEKSDALHCGHCGKLLPVSKRLRKKCPYCKSLCQATSVSEISDAEADAMQKREDERCMREERRYAIKTLREYKRFKLYSGIRIHARENSCEFGRKQNGKVIPIGECTPEMLPPFPQCENANRFCYCGFESVLSSAGGWRR